MTPAWPFPSPTEKQQLPRYRMIGIVCLRCGTSKLVPRSRRYTAKYCSTSCRARADRTAKFDVKCVRCGSHFTAKSHNAYYCGPDCYEKARYARKLKRLLVEPGAAAIEIPIGTTVADAERMLIEATLQVCKGDREAAANALGVSVKTVYNKLAAYAAPGAR